MANFGESFCYNSSQKNFFLHLRVWLFPKSAGAVFLTANAGKCPPRIDTCLSRNQKIKSPSERSSPHHTKLLLGSITYSEGALEVMKAFGISFSIFWIICLKSLIIVDGEEEGVCVHGSTEDGECINPQAESNLDKHDDDQNEVQEQGEDNDEGSVDEETSPDAVPNEDGGEEQEEEGECYDLSDDCEERALNDGCILDFESMAHDCEMTCSLCTLEQDPSKITNMYSLVPQLLYNDETLAEYASHVDEYVYESIFMREDVPESIKLGCKNKDPQCLFWAHSGECDRNKDFMLDRCLAACMDCENEESYAVRCPFSPHEPVIWEIGDMHQMFTHLVTSPEHYEYSPEVVSRPISKPNPKFDERNGPWVVILDEFLSEEECDALLSLSEEGNFEIIDGIIEGTESEQYYKSRKCTDECLDAEIVGHVEEILQYMTGVPQSHIEAFEFLKFEEGAFQGLHSDFLPKELSLAQGPRILSFLVFLNDVPQVEGDEENPNGGIYFDEIDVVSDRPSSQLVLALLLLVSTTNGMLCYFRLFIPSPAELCSFQTYWTSIQWLGTAVPSTKWLP